MEITANIAILTTNKSRSLLREETIKIPAVLTIYILFEIHCSRHLCAKLSVYEVIKDKAKQAARGEGLLVI